MSYITVRHYQTKSGLKWTATKAEWSPKLGKVVEVKVESLALESLGFSLNMTPTQAKAHAKKLNALNIIERKDQNQQVKAAERLTDLITIENSIVPEEMSTAFIQHLEANWYGGDYNLRKQIQHWNLVQKIITKLKIQPHEYFKRQREFYKYFEKQKYSASYVEKILRVLNAWGEFYSDESKTYFKRIPNPKGIVLEAINDASTADGEGATPLTTDILKKMKLKMIPEQWNYIRATLWLGLRPSELDNILENPSHLKVSKQDDTTVISIYQPKLTSVQKEKRWKHIPLFHPEMEKALEDIKNNSIGKPLVKTLKKVATGVRGIGLYSGRKGFTDLMLSLGQSLEDISMWLGHTSIERTWKHYKNKNIVKFKKIKTV